MLLLVSHFTDESTETERGGRLSPAPALGRSRQDSRRTARPPSLCPPPRACITQPCFLLIYPPALSPEASLCSCLSPSPEGRPLFLFSGLSSICDRTGAIFAQPWSSTVPQNQSLRTVGKRMCALLDRYGLGGGVRGPELTHNSADSGDWSWGLRRAPPSSSPRNPASPPAPGLLRREEPYSARQTFSHFTFLKFSFQP